jgi:hypothetical protein
MQRAARGITWLGALLLVGGLLWDIILHATDPELAAYEEVSTLFVPPHLMLAVGSLLTGVGVALSL